MDENFAMGYAMGQDNNGNRCNDGLFSGGSGGWLGILLLIALLGGGLGFGGFGGFGGGAGLQGIATRADINEGFALQNITSGIQAIQQGICDATYALNNTLMNGFHGVDTGLCNLGYQTQAGFNSLSHQLSDCCCENRAAIAQVRYDMATEACETRRAIQDSTRNILDFLTQDKISTLQAENQALKFAASQAQQNDYLTATMDANVATILRRTGHDCPTAAYIVQPPTPVNFPTNGCGTVQFGYNGYGSGCCNNYA